jgi:3-hydroxybutyryl-CoA dehydrogenase
MTQAIQTSAIVGVIGAGAMGAGIAQVAALAGHTVLLYDLDAKALDKAHIGIATNVQRLIDKKKLDQATGDKAVDRVRIVTNLADLRTASLVIEAVAERLDQHIVHFDHGDRCAPEASIARGRHALLQSRAADGARRSRARTRYIR